MGSQTRVISDNDDADDSLLLVVPIDDSVADDCRFIESQKIESQKIIQPNQEFFSVDIVNVGSWL